MSDDAFARAARGLANGEVSRRSILRMVLGTTAAATVGGTALSGWWRSAVGQADPCNGTRRPVSGPDDCPGNRVPKNPATYTPKRNGCGPQSGTDRVPDDFFFWSFRSACNGHDDCYGTCGSSQSSCDSQFYDAMRAECRASTFVLSPTRSQCMGAASLYYSAVAGLGKEPHQEGQAEGCDCCESTTTTSTTTTTTQGQCVRCNCNGVVYRDVQVCLNNCRVSLGCFTGICAPVECPGVS